MHSQQAEIYRTICVSSYSKKTRSYIRRRRSRVSRSRL